MPRLLLVALVVFVAACDSNREGAAADAPAGPSPASVTMTASGAPMRADGYWELKNIGGGGTMIGTQYLCVG